MRCCRASSWFLFLGIVMLQHDSWPVGEIRRAWEVVEVDSHIHHLIKHAALPCSSPSRGIGLCLAAPSRITSIFIAIDMTRRREFWRYLRELTIICLYRLIRIWSCSWGTLMSQVLLHGFLHWSERIPCLFLIPILLMFPSRANHHYFFDLS